MNKEEVIKQYKSLFPDNVEAIILTKEDYDRQLGQLQYENIELKLEIEKAKKEWEEFLKKSPSIIRVEKAIEYITNNFADIDYMKSRYSEQDINTHIAEIPITDIEKLLDILKGNYDKE